MIKFCRETKAPVHIKQYFTTFYPTRLAAKPPAGWVLRLFWIMFVHFGFPHHWLYTMLLATHLRRGLRGLRHGEIATERLAMLATRACLATK